MTKDYKEFYSEFINAHGNKLHFAAHSHHFWPNSARIGHMESYDHSMKESDNKWDYIFTTLIPDVQDIISSIIGFDRPADIAFAPNTHDLLTRILSSIIKDKPLKLLTSNSEFHSFSRQLRRLQEDNLVEVTIIDPELLSFDVDLEKALNTNQFDLIFLSHVFFTSGLVLSEENIQKIIQFKGDAEFILDAYHGFCAVPTDITKYSDHLFYMAGGYKYAQAGEGMCFMTIPKDCKLRPLYTGWFSSFKDLESKQSGPVSYASDGMRFWGSTIDCTSFYRFRSVWRNFKRLGISANDLIKHVKNLQLEFMQENPLSEFIIEKDPSKIGHFITVKLNSAELAASVKNQLGRLDIMTDNRGTYLRFGHANYHNQQDIKDLKTKLKLLKLQ